MPLTEHFVSRAPWGTEPGLKQKAEEVGVDFDRLVAAFAANRSDSEIAGEYGVPDKTITYLREYFEHKGIHSIVGQD